MLQFLILLFLPLVFSDCPPNSVKWPDFPPSKCYTFIENSLSFDEAEYDCKKANGHLASVHEGFTNSFIRSKATNAGALWLGLTRSSSSANWTWTDGSNFDFTEIAATGNADQNCGFMNASNGMWYPDACLKTHSYVCETDELQNLSTFPATAPTTTPYQPTLPPGENCPDNWLYFEETNSCYYWADLNDWSTAEEFCKNNSAHLASLHSKSEFDLLKLMYNGQTWIGLYTEDANITWETKWLWTDGSPVDYTVWSPSSLPSSTYQCVVASDATFAASNCSLLKYSICKKPSSIPSTYTPPPITNNGCPQGWNYFEPSNSCFFYENQVKLSWSTAREFCAFNGGSLASIHSYAEFQYAYSRYGYPAWIGLYTDDNPVELNSTWQWVDRSPFDYRNWYNTVPSLNSYRCATLNYNSFLNADCSTLYYPLCKKASTKIISTTSPISTTTAAPTPCPDSWIYNNDFCYNLITFNWTISEEWCSYYGGGHLTSIRNYAELVFLRNYLYQQYRQYYAFWIGLYSDDKTLLWKWTDGTSFTYNNWAPNYPLRTGQNRAYVGQTDAKFYNDADPSGSRMAFCKKPARKV